MFSTGSAVDRDDSPGHMSWQWSIALTRDSSRKQRSLPAEVTGNGSDAAPAGVCVPHSILDIRKGCLNEEPSRLQELKT